MIIGLICVDSQQNRALESLEPEDVAATTRENLSSEGGLWVLGIQNSEFGIRCGVSLGGQITMASEEVPLLRAAQLAFI